MYSDKLLHLLIPLYKDEFESYKDNTHLKKYLDYIIGECGHDIVYKNNNGYIGNEKDNIHNKEGKDYDGDDIPIEILESYCTTGYNKFTDFERFLRTNNIINEETYNELQEKQQWMPLLGNIRKKYPKFCFRNIDINRDSYYDSKDEAVKKYKEYEMKLTNNISKEKIKRLTLKNKIKKINELYDKKIPNIDFELYYPE
jgi:hypothetical protein